MTHQQSLERRVASIVLVTGATLLASVAWYNSHFDTKKIVAFRNIASAVLESANDPMAVVDAEGKILFWNAAMQRLTGYSMDQVNSGGGIALMGCSDDAISRHNAGMKRAFADEADRAKVTNVNCSIKTASGEITPVKIQVRISDDLSGNKVAVARIDPQSRFVEFGQPEIPAESR